MKLLLTDTSHTLGTAIEHELEREPFNLLQPSRQEVNWQSADAVDDYLRQHRPDVVINTLGWGDSDASADKTLLPIAASHLARACAAYGSVIVQMSSYRVFGDDNKSKHLDTDACTPNSDLGRALLQAEQAVLNTTEAALILRTSWTISSYGDNRLRHLLGALAQNKPWRVNARLRGAPTALSDVARVVVALIKQIASGAECWGVYQYCSGDVCNQVELAEQLWEALGQQGYQGPEPRWDRIDEAPQGEPVSAVLSSLKVRNDFGVQTRSWRTYLMPMVKQWLNNQTG
ncbi:NAD(P)-dependent oxidoreductase [Gilvimarinus agarilyticus]|uniref:SDR family oxidoreductase n=1 Tax=unclassified Gilvimarinus TaxID=2642066 RepID=UPI001C085214|nr:MULTISPECIES: sugar nucleotide-binding protein [unclassified Gilvimarinus]MBU2886676.1 NAD(P)-dependent oxidoreductase [Gilvimarinus agarilyticus]MDO6571344.1 sugar nucleotide-binding protein [Gilvimarinus sp. 2_MG-2023]MDO6746240.1 sugar nucleotide-binding protein [Gilvimarinus sp. 1_MG-2023]